MPDQRVERGAPAVADPRFAAGFTGAEVAEVRRRVGEVALQAGLDALRAEDWVCSVNELMINAVRHGGGYGWLSLWTAPGLICEVRDRGHGFDPSAYLGRSRRPPLSPTGGMGLWLVQTMTHVLSIDSGPTGTTVRITAAPVDPAR